MTAFFIGLAVFIAVISVWVMWGRSWMKEQPWAQGFFAAIEPYEIAIYKKSQTIFLARLKMFIGVLLTFLTQIGTIDLTPLMPFVPDEWEGTLRAVFNLIPLIITVVGMMDEKLRNTSTKPIEIVALPEAVAASMPSVVKAEEAKIEAVAVVKEAQV